MDCLKARCLISLRMDGVIKNSEDTELAGHLSECAACTRELALQEKISVALQEISREEVQAPADLCSLVMERLRLECRETKRGTPSWLPVSWRKAIAAVAAVLLIAGGSAGTMLNMADRGKTTVVYENSPSDIIADNSGEATAPGSSTEGSTLGNGETQSSGKEGSPVDTTGDSSFSEPGGTVTVNPGAENTTGAEVFTTSAGSRFLLSSGMKVNSTVLKIAVGDLTEARARSVAMATGLGAATQVFPEQSGDKNIVLVRITVASEQSSGLVSELARLGTLIDRQDDSRDLTSIYNETVVQYNDLQSRVGMVQDDAEKRQLEAQAASYRQQMEGWKTEAGKRVIMLWLESK